MSLIKNMMFKGEKTANWTPVLPADNCDILFMVWSSQRNGHTCLPCNLGLSEMEFSALKNYLIESGFAFREEQAAHETEDLRQSLLEMRRDEWTEIRDLLITHRAGKHYSEVWMASIVAAGCLGADHLWRDLGLEARSLLSELLNDNFPMLASSNIHDMKWKKFLYKQLCEREGAYVCRAPSCQQCTAYHDCFGPEE